MTAMELDAFKAQITDEVNRATSLDELLDTLNALVHACMTQADDSLWGRIPGVPCTMEEVQEVVDDFFRRKAAGEPVEMTEEEADAELQDKMPWLA